VFSNSNYLKDPLPLPQVNLQHAQRIRNSLVSLRLNHFIQCPKYAYQNHSDCESSIAALQDAPFFSRKSTNHHHYQQHYWFVVTLHSKINIEPMRWETLPTRSSHPCCCPYLKSMFLSQHLSSYLQRNKSKHHSFKSKSFCFFSISNSIVSLYVYFALSERSMYAFLKLTIPLSDQYQWW